MAEPERRDEPEPQAAPQVVLEPEVLETSAPPPAPEAPVLTEGTLLVQTVHVSLWTIPVSYLCLRCPAKDFTYEAVCTHVRTVHGVEPLPTPLAADYVARNPVVLAMLREEAPAEKVMAAPQPEDDDAPRGEESSP